MRVPLRTVLLGLLALIPVGDAHAEDAEDWLRPDGAGDMTWGTSQQPFDVVPAPQALVLPDSGHVGRHPSDRPDDLELTGSHPLGERRFLRYLGGQLVDAWVMRDSPIHLTPFELAGDPDWSGPVLGPGVDGWRNVGDARSWTIGDRSVLSWEDRMGPRHVVASRAAPTGRYAVVRAAPLTPGGAGRASARIKGELKDTLKPVAEHISGCLENAPKPIEVRIEVAYDSKGRPGRLRATSDQPSPKLVDCVAAAIIHTGANPGTEGSVTVFRLR